MFFAQMAMFYNPNSNYTKKIRKGDSEALFKKIQEIKIRKNKFLFEKNNSLIFPKIKYKINEPFSFNNKFQFDKHSKILEEIKIKNRNDDKNNKLKKSLSMVDMITKNKKKIRQLENQRILEDNFLMGERLCNTKHAISCRNYLYLPKIKTNKN